MTVTSPPFGRFYAILNGIQKVEISYSYSIDWKLRTMGDDPRWFQGHQLESCVHKKLLTGEQDSIANIL